MDEVTRDELSVLRKRVEELEAWRRTFIVSAGQATKKSDLGKKAKGIQKGVQEILNNGFFSTPKSIVEAKSELERLGYFGMQQRIDTVIRRDFFKRKHLLTRVKANGSWKYTAVK